MDNKDLIIMYHYVREPKQWTGSVPISVEDFRRQIEWAKENFEVVTPSNMHKETDKPKCIISFDDATRDQYRNAFHVLKELGIPGYFTIMSGPLQQRKIPVFHLVHAVLSNFTDEEIWKDLSVECDEDVIFQKSEVYSYEESKYRRLVKYVLNFYWSEPKSRQYLEGKVTSLYGSLDKFIEEFYIQESEIIEMFGFGMEIGVHCVDHLPYDKDAQKFYEQEIEPCKQYLEGLLQTNIHWYTPAFGGGENFEHMNNHLTPILKKNGFKGAFSTVYGYTNMQQENQFWFERMDCNKLNL